MRHNRSDRKFSGAFTLLELIVAITLMDLIALTLYSSMYIGMKAKKNASEALRPYRSAIPVFEYLKKDLESAVKPAGILAGSFVGQDAEGKNASDILTFHCCGYQPKEGERASNIIRVEYTTEEDDLSRGGFVLVRKKTTNLLSSKTPQTEDAIICRGIYSFDVKYYDGYGWVDSWDSTTLEDKLPYAVQMELTINDSGVYPDTSGGNGYGTVSAGRDIINGRSGRDDNGRIFTRTIFLSRVDKSGSVSGNGSGSTNGR